jgi:hypothetical protein
LVINFAAKINDSSGENVSSKTSSYYTNAPNLLKSFFLISLLLHLINPYNFEFYESHILYPSTLSNDVLPHPLAPIIESIYPGLAYPVKLCKICLCLPLPIIL